MHHTRCYCPLLSPTLSHEISAIRCHTFCHSDSFLTADTNIHHAKDVPDSLLHLLAPVIALCLTFKATYGYSKSQAIPLPTIAEEGGGATIPRKQGEACDKGMTRLPGLG